MDLERERRNRTFTGLIYRFSVEYSEALAFIAGWSAYPIGQALLLLMLNR